MKFLITVYQHEDAMYIAECLAVRAEKGLPMTVMTRELEVPL